MVSRPKTRLSMFPSTRGILERQGELWPIPYLAFDPYSLAPAYVLAILDTHIEESRRPMDRKLPLNKSPPRALVDKYVSMSISFS